MHSLWPVSTLSPQICQSFDLDETRIKDPNQLVLFSEESLNPWPRALNMEDITKWGGSFFPSKEKERERESSRDTWRPRSPRTCSPPGLGPLFQARLNESTTSLLQETGSNWVCYPSCGWLKTKKKLKPHLNYGTCGFPFGGPFNPAQKKALAKSVHMLFLACEAGK